MLPTFCCQKKCSLHFRTNLNTGISYTWDGGTVTVYDCMYSHCTHPIPNLCNLVDCVNTQRLFDDPIVSAGLFTFFVVLWLVVVNCDDFVCWSASVCVSRSIVFWRAKVCSSTIPRRATGQVQLQMQMQEVPPPSLHQLQYKSPVTHLARVK